MANISFIDVGNNTIHPLSLPYCTCATAKGTAAKTATLANFTLVDGCCVHVKFTYANSAASPTLNINSTGAKPIVAYGTTAPTITWKAGSVIEFIYDGTSYVMSNCGAFNDAVLTASGSVSASASIEASPGTVSINENSSSVSGKTRVACTPTSATTGITKYYMAVRATADVGSGSAPITGSGTATAGVSTEGFAPSALTATAAISVSGSASAIVTAKNSVIHYIPIDSAENSGVVSTHTVSGPTIVISGTATGFTPLSGSETSPYYVTASASQSTYGWSSVKAKGSITHAGYIEVSESSESSLSSVQINANLGGSKKVYIPAGVITNNTSGGSSSGTIASGQQIKIGKGFYPNDLYYTAQAGGGGWTSGTFTKVGSPGNPDEQSLYVWAGDYNSSWVSVGGGYSAKFGACTHYMSNKSTSNELCDYYQFGSCTQAEPLKVIILSGSSNWAIFFGTFNYEPSTSGNNYYYLDLSTTVAGKTFLFEIYPDNSTGNIQYRYKEM